MNSILVSFRLRGGVKQLRTAENISEEECTQLIENARKGNAFGGLTHLNTGIKNHAIENEEFLCEKRVSFDEAMVAGILDGSNRPSLFQCRQFKLGYQSGRKYLFNVKKWQQLPAQQRLSIWLSDLAHDYQAVSYTWVELG